MGLGGGGGIAAATAALYRVCMHLLSSFGRLSCAEDRHEPGWAARTCQPPLQVLLHTAALFPSSLDV